MKLNEIKENYKLNDNDLDLIAIAMFNSGIFKSAPEISVSRLVESVDLTSYRVQFQSVVNCIKKQKAKGVTSMNNKYLYDRIKQIKAFKGQKGVISKLKYIIIPEMLEKGLISDYDGKTLRV